LKLRKIFGEFGGKLENFTATTKKIRPKREIMDGAGENTMKW